LRATLTVADAILIPFQPRSVDLWTGSQIAALVAEARHVNEELQRLRPLVQRFGAMLLEIPVFAGVYGVI
jgi:hypothetical protein